jgi:LPS export ABC transporter protein LptC
VRRLFHLCAFLTLLSGCTDNLSALKEINRFDQSPIGITENLYLIYSDSAFVEAILEAEKNIDFTNQKFPYSEFPEGLEVTLFDRKGNQTHVYADYGIYYPKTEIIDLQGNVIISDSTGVQLNTHQLYWDAGQEWLFTEKNFTFTSEDYDINATQLDANRSFTKLVTGVLRGTVQVQEDQL